MKITRHRILDYLEAQRQATPVEIGRALGLPVANVRHHLKILEDENAVQVIGERRLPGRGRPQHLYASSRQVQQHNLDALCAALLDYSLDNLDEQKLPLFLQQIAQRLLHPPAPAGNRAAPGTPLAGSPGSSSALTSRLVAAVRQLNQLNYAARWEAHPTAPRIIFAHCPFRALVDSHPQICQLDAAMLQTLLQSPVAQLEKLAKDRRGALRCVFSLQAR